VPSLARNGVLGNDMGRLLRELDEEKMEKVNKKKEEAEKRKPEFIRIDHLRNLPASQ
jgi:hypothetical protein